MNEDGGGSAEGIKEELRGSVEFVVGVLVFGAAIFSVLLNLCFLAVENDLALKRAYLIISNTEHMTAGEIHQAIEIIDQHLVEDVRQGGRPVLCEEDLDLIELYTKLPEEQQTILATLLARKTGVTSHWKQLYFTHLPSSRSPFRMPFLQLNLLYYGWMIEIATIIFLSQSLRKSHVQESLYHTIRKAKYFLPVVSLLLFVPAWHWATLLYPRTAGTGIFLLVGLACLLGAFVLFKVAQVRLSPNKMNELGFHLLISSLFVQLLTVMGDPDVVYGVFTAPRMQSLRYISWFIILCYPGLLFEKWYRARGSGP